MSVEIPFFAALIGKKLSSIWRGTGSAVFFEFGDQVTRPHTNGREDNPRGELTLMIEWSWRIEDENTILCGSWSDTEGWLTVFDDVVGSEVKDIVLIESPLIC